MGENITFEGQETGGGAIVMEMMCKQNDKFDEECVLECIIFEV
jgi:hypothetical protein